MSLDHLWKLLTADTKLLWAALISAIVSAGVTYLLKRLETRDRLKAEYEYDQRKKLRELIGRYHGRLLQAANVLNYRFWNLYKNKDAGWLDMHGHYSANCYYFNSSVHRFLNVCALMRKFEAEAIYLDARIATKSDFTFLNYLSALRWTLTDVALVEGLPYDSFHQKDHFFADNLRHYSDWCWQDGEFVQFDEFQKKLTGEEIPIVPVLQFFDSLNDNEDRLRWDRLVAFHLLLLAFINSFGHKTQKSLPRYFEDAARQARNPKVLNNLVIWLPKFGLDKDREAKCIKKAVATITKSL
jgi:hypothetical protein